MLARMSKVEIVGPKGMLQDLLALLQKLKVLEIESEPDVAAEKTTEEKIGPFLRDERERALFERLFLDDLNRKIDQLFTYLPSVSVRTSYIEPESIIGTILHTVEKHLAAARELHEEKMQLNRDGKELARFSDFLSTLASLFRNAHTPPSFDIIGLTIKDTNAVDQLRTQLAKLTGGNFKMYTVPAGDGTLAGMITIEKNASESVSKTLTQEHIPEMTFPPVFDDLTLSEKITYLEARSLELSMKIEAIDLNLVKLAQRWMPIYRRVQEWIGERVSVLVATASVCQTKLCFYVRGWMPTDEVKKLQAQLNAQFHNEVVLQEQHVRERELEHAPVVLMNPPYFKPFEIFGRLLPLPTYTSLDPTPYIGIFFPIFFGMILGDAGYGAILAIAAFFLRKAYKTNRDVKDACHVLLVSSAYTILFGALYGELFGDLGTRLFGLEPLLIERRTSIVPMLVFALSAGVVHVLLGLVLGVISAFKKKFRREGLYKLLNIIIILCMIAVFASFFGFFPKILSRPIIIGILLIAPFLFFTGGILAPLELLKSIGNIISYVRIMAIGLTSVLLAYVANKLAGEMGDIVMGVTVAAVLHILNMILGVFSPTIHSLRLHYVEFFSKFVERGGRKFEPLGK